MTHTTADFYSTPSNTIRTISFYSLAIGVVTETTEKLNLFSCPAESYCTYTCKGIVTYNSQQCRYWEGLVIYRLYHIRNLRQGG